VTAVARRRPALVRSARAGVPDAAVRAALADGGWQRERTLTTLSGTAVIMVSAPGGRTGVLKISATEAGTASLRREHGVLRRLGRDERLGEWRDLLPVPLRWGDSGAGAYLLTSRLPGRDGRQLPQGMAGGLTRAAFRAIAPLHDHDRTVAEVDATLLRRWVDEPAARLAEVARPARVARVGAALHAGLAGRRMTLGWTHGDFHPGNVLAGSPERVAGIIDWDQARERDLVATDLAFWIITAPGTGRHRELGARVAARLDADRCWTPAESRLLAGTDDAAAGRALLLLAWLRHVAGNLAKSSRYARSPLWLRNNVRPVLRQVAGG
jgi:aminoglycoside phosphotransferase (APT) family kinase protein